ncbi:hypothetical protein JYG23_13195 [Sedimentibacter sp. zth1]|uniref:hypothetical protein n=1 Tax=Sedimentibacter sp. zth1 TaxID=2816908 RepID=UPI001A938633|nr:hypothetical protein [Sedimentibacter sp. zth1]QSX05610.1 hypothetical protein JYG23_13195 [Sedimentibacter sp. zth1]
MSQSTANTAAVQAKNKLKSNFVRKGVFVGILSGILYGLYSAFLAAGMKKGIWADWYGANTAGLSALTIIYLLSAMGSAINDLCSAVWAIGFAGLKGKLGDLVRCFKTKPGLIMIVAALIGGPIASTAYVVGLQMAGPIAIPISALCPAIAAILGRILFKQEINKRMWLGIAVCVGASFLIGSTSITGEAPDGMILGLGIALIAALGWGFEGCVAGYGTSMIDPQIGIAIRQVTSGISTIAIVLPLMSLICKNDLGSTFALFGQAITSGPAMIWFALSGLCSFATFMLWYIGNSMCGAALGTACNGTYSFFGPFFCWIILGVILGIPGNTIPSVVWVGAVLMMFGILTISMNPLDLLRKRGGQQ